MGICGIKTTSDDVKPGGNLIDPFQPAFDVALQQYSQFGPGCPAELQEAIHYCLLAPGKRLRPALVLYAASACGADWKSAVPAACAVEMVHTYSLIHDDLPAMDDDDLRRGRPSCHVQFGEATAILTGDALLTAAFGTLANGLRPPDVAMRCVSELANAAGATGMVGGQVDDLRSQLELSVDRLANIHIRKTAALLRASVRMGGFVAFAADDDLKRLTDYGNNLGLAFQIVDDLLDELGDESNLGKRTGKDVDSGKWTYPRLIGVEPSWDKARKLVEDACRNAMELGPRAEPLIELAHFVVSRRH